MNKAELVTAIAEAVDLKPSQAEKALNAFLDTVSNELANGGNVKIVGFGTFTTSKRAARTGVKPGTTEKVSIPARVVPKFKAGSGLKEAVQ